MRNRYLVSFSNLLILLFFIGFTVSSDSILEHLENKGYDAFLFFLDSSRTKSPVALIDIDDRALGAFGPWPWPRARMAQAIQKAVTNGARVIGLPLLLDTSEDNSAGEALAGFSKAFRATFAVEDDPKLKAFYETIEEIRGQVDPNRLLAEAITTAGTVVLPVRFNNAPAKTVLPLETFNLFLEKSRSISGVFDKLLFPRGNAVILPQPIFLKKARRLGHLNYFADRDGRIRRESPIFRYQDKSIASFSLALMADYLNIPEKELSLRRGDTLYLNGRRILLSGQADFLIRFNRSPNPFERCGFTELISEKIPSYALSDKIVIFNLCATGMAPRMATPIDSQMPLGELTAHTLNTLWSGLPVRVVPYQRWISLLMVLVVGILTTFVFPRISTFNGSIFSLAGVSLMMGGSIFLFKLEDIWLPFVSPVVQLLIGFVLAASLSRIPARKTGARAKAAAEEIRRLQGMSLQSQGLPEAAWEKLQQLPIDEDLKEILYDLALDFEKKEKADKALMVYEHIEEVDAEYRDIQARMIRLVKPSEAIAPEVKPEIELKTKGEAVSKQAPAFMGRYQLVKPIGQGAMGTVYLGQDPHINRKIAIKTYRFEEEFDPADAIEMKRKFFREAQSAGKLAHPGIVTIFDVGEVGDLAYIAMEFLEGTDFRAHVTKGKLLPVRKVIRYVADIADALAYAHRQGVVHRDIKPANIMLLKSDAVKITDFGIARIIATSRTRTGIVKGTPFYMAPEQITGKKVDGRSDIFSLGVVLYQLLTGSLPFTAPNPGALTHKIVNDPHPDPRHFNPNILAALVTVINHALEKNVKRRYQDGSQMATHLRLIERKINMLMALKAENHQNR